MALAENESTIDRAVEQTDAADEARLERSLAADLCVLRTPQLGRNAMTVLAILLTATHMLAASDFQRDVDPRDEFWP